MPKDIESTTGYSMKSIFHPESNQTSVGCNAVILTGHDEYFGLDAKVLKGVMGQECPVVVEGRNVVDADGFIGAGFMHKGIGRGG